MDDEALTQRVQQAIEVAATAWDRAHRGLPSNAMTRTAAIPATGILAAALLDDPDADPAASLARIERAITIARRAWEATHVETPGNPIASTAVRSVIGILAAGILNSQRSTDPSPSR